MKSDKYGTYQALMLIATPKLADKAVEMFSKKNLPVQYKVSAQGTASSEIMDTLGLGSIDKSLLVAFVHKSFAEEMLGLLHSKLRLDAVNSGIAFTLPLGSASNIVVRMMQSVGENSKNGKGEGAMAQNNKYVLIAAIVDRGFSGDVMDAAREKGAGGGTVVHSRSFQNDEATGFWGLSVQEEKEIVLILASSENKLDIMSAIGEKCGMHSDAKGTVISLPIDAVMGI